MVAPGSHDEVRAVLQACAQEGVAVVPFGGGTSVVGGIGPPPRDSFAARRVARSGADGRLESVDARALTAVFGPGSASPRPSVRSPSTTSRSGHFPQSFEWATVGGCVATRSAGQASTGFGRIDENVVSLRCATPAGDLGVLDAPGDGGRDRRCARSWSARRARSGW